MTGRAGSGPPHWGWWQHSVSVWTPPVFGAPLTGQASTFSLAQLTHVLIPPLPRPKEPRRGICGQPGSVSGCGLQEQSSLIPKLASKSFLLFLVSPRIGFCLPSNKCFWVRRDAVAVHRPRFLECGVPFCTLVTCPVLNRIKVCRTAAL